MISEAAEHSSWRSLLEAAQGSALVGQDSQLHGHAHTTLRCTHITFFRGKRGQGADRPLTDRKTNRNWVGVVNLKLRRLIFMRIAPNRKKIEEHAQQVEILTSDIRYLEYGANTGIYNPS